MKLNHGLGKKWKHGSASVAITAAVIAVVILVNLLVGALCSENLWFLDLTPYKVSVTTGELRSFQMYKLTETTKNLLASTLEQANEGRAEDEPAVVDIIFCADPDMICANEWLRYVYYTALQMQKLHPDQIRVSTRDVWENPSSVDAYRTNSYSSIYQTNVIVASGTEFRIYNYKSFYTIDTEASGFDPWAYNAEKTFLSGIIAVTRAESPICVLTTNHGEPFATEEGRAEYSKLVEVIEGAGYDVQYLDLAAEELPENCRLVITFDPQTDFKSSFLGDGVSETLKLEKHLDKAYSFMVFADADTPKLPNLEEFLEEWGIAFEQYESTDAQGNTVGGSYELVDADNSLDTDGFTIIGQYETEGLGGSLTTSMRESGAAPKVIFGNAASITYAPNYEKSYQLADEENGIGAYTFGAYYRNGWSRDIYDVFRTGTTSFAYAKDSGNRLLDQEGKPIVAATYDQHDPFRLMTITRHSRTVGEGKGYTNVNDASYVCAVASTDFASNRVLSSNAYGNTDILLQTLRQIGREVEPVGITLNPMYDAEIDPDFYTTQSNTVYTVVLALIPAFACALAGFVVLLKRRARS
jgi:hypothetical protein